MAKKPVSAESSPKPVSGFGKLYNLARERWPEYVIEIIVIIFSISISFYLDEWKDGQHKQELEQIYLKGLYTDLQTDSSQLNEVIAETRQILERVDRLSTYNRQAAKRTYGEVADDLRFTFKRPRFISEDATFADLKSTGNMQVVSNFALKKMIFDYYKQYETIIRVETAELDVTNTVLAPYILSKFSLTGQPSQQQPTAWTSTMGETEFQNMLLVRRATRSDLLQDYQQSLALSSRMMALIKPALK